MLSLFFKGKIKPYQSKGELYFQMPCMQKLEIGLKTRVINLVRLSLKEHFASGIYSSTV
jgi:hypothetical protein